MISVNKGKKNKYHQNMQEIMYSVYYNGILVSQKINAAINK